MNISKWDARFLRLAEHVSKWSKDPSTKTGAVIVFDRIVLGVGYNGFPQGMSDDAALYADREQKYSRVVHCEVNALIFANQVVRGATLYTWPFMSCDRCVVQMIQAGITRFVAPQAPEEQAARWETTFIKTRAYIEEAGLSLLEVPHIDIPVSA